MKKRKEYNLKGAHSSSVLDISGRVSREISFLLLVEPDDMNFTHRFPYS